VKGTSKDHSHGFDPWEMAEIGLDPEGSAAAADQDWEWHEVGRQRLAVARKWSPFFLAGVVANSTLCILVLLPTFRVETLALWGLLHGAATAVVGLSLMRAKQPDRRTGSGLPLNALLGSAVIGALWGLPIWLDGTASRVELAQWQTGAFLLLTTFLAVAFLEGARGLSRNVLLPAWLLYGVGLGLFGSPALAGAALCLLVVTSVGSHMRGRATDEALSRQSVADRQVRAAQWRAHHDPLTGVLNRHGLRCSLDKPTLESSHFLLLIALDHFGTVNDQHGIGVGDSVLREVAQRIASLSPDEPETARVSGDEFVVLFASRDDAKAQQLADDIIARIADPIYRTGEEIRLSATIGITQALGRPLDLGRAMRESNAALRKIRRSARGQALLFSREMESKLEERIHLESALHRALVHGEIQVWGQPIVHLASQIVSHVELVARWIRPDGKRIPPSVFVPMAEEIGIVGDLTDHMIRGAGEAIHTFHDHQWLRNAKLVVNIRAEEIRRPDMIPNLRAAVEGFDIEPGRLSLGIKGAKDMDRQEAIQLVTDLTEMGVGIGLDDLSDGGGWLAQMTGMKAGLLRVDKSLVKGARESESQRSFVAALNQLGWDLGFAVVGEGVEDAETAAVLRETGIRHAQGWHFARAMPLDKLVSAETAIGIREALSSASAAEAPDIVAPSHGRRNQRRPIRNNETSVPRS